MNTKYFLFLFFLFFTGTCAGFAQSRYQFGMLPSVNLNQKFKNDWSLNTKLESRQLFMNGTFSGISNTKYQYVLTDFSVLFAKKVSVNSRVAGGYLIRVEGPELMHRFIQQYTMVQRLSGFSLAHRVMADQSFSVNENPEFRFRYRITSEIPLSGESVDPKEFYVKLNNEYVNSLQSIRYDLEIRVVPLLGYNINNTNKLEFGGDYRVNSFFNNSIRHSFWASLNWFIEI